MKRLQFVFLAVLSLISSVLLAAPRTFVSAIDGNDMNPCTRPLPCRSFAAAIPLTDFEGEGIAVDSGGYGPMTITFTISIIAPSGVYAGITAFSGNAVTVNATGQVLLKNLYLNSQGADLGILASNGSLQVEGCVINGFSEGIVFNPSNSDARLYVRNTFIRRSAIGIYLSTAKATLETVRLYGNDSGVEVDSGEMTIRKSVASGPGTYGFRGETNSKMTIEDSVSSGNAYGFFANAGAVMFATRCAATSNTSAGMKAQFSPSAIYVSDSTIATNAVGISASNSGAVFSRCTDVLTGSPPPACPAGHFSNTLQANTSDGVFTGSYTSN